MSLEHSTAPFGFSKAAEDKIREARKLQKEQQRIWDEWQDSRIPNGVRIPQTLGETFDTRRVKVDEAKDTNPKDAIGSDKLPMHLVSGIVKAYQAIAHFLGNVKYGAWNYRAKGARASVYRAALDRHMDAWWEGEELDPTDGTPHLANALACINILIEAKEAGKLVDDRPPPSAYRAVMDRLTPMVKAIKEKYKDSDPIHYSIERPE